MLEVLVIFNSGTEMKNMHTHVQRKNCIIESQLKYIR